jgi:hypothetical protein
MRGKVVNDPAGLSSSNRQPSLIHKVGSMCCTSEEGSRCYSPRVGGMEIQTTTNVENDTSFPYARTAQSTNTADSVTTVIILLDRLSST